MAMEPKTGGDIQKHLGSFWSRHFPGKGTLRAFLDSLVLAYKQTQQALLETEAAVGRRTIPLYHRELLFPLKLTYSSGDTLDYNKIKYGSGILYGSGNSYGDLITFVPEEITPAMAARVEARKSYRSTLVTRRPIYPLPSGLKRIGMLSNRISQPSMVMVNGIDFIIDEGVIVFTKEPFNMVEIPQLELYNASGVHYDDEILLWATAADFDFEYVYNHLGYIFELRGETGTVYRDILNLVWDCLQEGITANTFRQMLSTVSGIPIAKDDETILIIQETTSQQVLVTESNVYAVPADAALSAFVGKQLKIGDFLSDGIQIFEGSGTNKTIPSDFDALVLGREFLGADYLSVISFPNKTVDLEYLGTDAAGYPKIRFEVNGFPGDVDAFWDAVHERGVAAGKVLANYLDIRETPADQPTAINLPETINPAQFVMENLIGDNLILVKMKLEQFTEDPKRTSYLSLIRQLLPAHTAFLLYIDAASSVEYVTSDDSSETLEGLVVDDSGVTLMETERVEEEIDGGVFSEFVTARLVAGNVV